MYPAPVRLNPPMPLAVNQLQLGPVGTNGYVIRASEQATAAVVIDPGADVDAIRSTLAQLAAECAGILLTHSHFDHFGALAELESATGAPVWLPAGELDVFARPLEYFPSFSVPAYEGASTPLAGGEAGFVTFQPPGQGDEAGSDGLQPGRPLVQPAIQGLGR